MTEFVTVGDFFEIFLIYEPLIEEARILLSSNTLFEPFNSFKEIDLALSGFITATDIYKYLQAHGIHFSLSSIDKLVSQYCLHHDGKIFVGEFLKFILPHTKTSLREDALSRTGGKLNFSLRQGFLRIFELELRMWQEIEKIIFQLKSQKTDLKKVFDEIDIPKTGFLTRDKLRVFLSKFNKNYEEADILTIFKRLDADCDDVISINEFFFALNHSPKILHSKPPITKPHKNEPKTV